jgi:hypothetical protein
VLNDVNEEQGYGYGYGYGYGNGETNGVAGKRRWFRRREDHVDRHGN